MESGTYEYRSEFARKYLAEGEAEGRAEGEAKGEAHGRAAAILRIAERRGLKLGEEHLERLRACTDIERLDDWIDRALVAEAANDVFD